MSCPARAVTSPSLLVSERSGAAVPGVVSLPVLLPGVESVPLVPSSAMLAELLTCVVQAGTGLATVTANVAVDPPPPATPPIVSEQVDPALLFGVQDHPAVLAPELKVVFAGTVSVIVTPVAPRLPALA